jgi:hypothetical protein
LLLLFRFESFGSCFDVSNFGFASRTKYMYMTDGV